MKMVEGKMEDVGGEGEFMCAEEAGEDVNKR